VIEPLALDAGVVAAGVVDPDEVVVVVDEFELPQAARPSAMRAAAGRATNLRGFTFAP
jgi:hypothetical protein